MKYSWNVITETLAAFSKKSSFAAVLRVSNMIDSCPCFSLDLHVIILKNLTTVAKLLFLLNTAFLYEKLLQLL